MYVSQLDEHSEKVLEVAVGDMQNKAPPDWSTNILGVKLNMRCRIVDHLRPHDLAT